MVQTPKYQYLNQTDRLRYRLLRVKSIFAQHGLHKIKAIWQKNYPDDPAAITYIYSVWNLRQTDKDILEKLESLAAQLEDQSVTP